MKNLRTSTEAFTLAEILVVIVIISVLAAFLLPAVMKGQQQSRVALCKTEITNIGLALESFKTDFGYYPPTALSYNPATGIFDGGGLGDYAYAEMLTQCLCNRFSKGSGDVAIQGTDRVLGGAPVNAGPYYKVKTNRLTDLDKDGWPELADPWGNPYIYISNVDYLDAAGTAYNAGALVWRDDTGDGINDPPDPTILTTAVPPLNEHFERFNYQLISRGADGWTPGIDVQDTDADGLPDGYKDISIFGNPYAGGVNPALVGTDTDPSNPVVDANLGHVDKTADDINNWQ